MDKTWPQIVISLLLCLSLDLCATAQSIPLKVDAGGASASDPVPLGCGIPLKEGQAKETDVLAIEAAGKGLIPAQFEVRTRYDSGSILWLWADFIGSPSGEYKLVVNQKNPAATLPDITVRNTKEELSINNGRVELVWNKELATPIKVLLVGKDGSREIATGDGGGIYLINDKDERAMLGGKNGELVWKIESQGKLRVVLRAEGWYTTKIGDRLARAIVRYHIYRDQPTVKMDHTFVVTKENDEIAYKELGITMPAGKSEKSRAVFADQNGVLPAIEIAKGKAAWIFQREYPVYNRKEYVCELGQNQQTEKTLKESASFAAVDTGSSCLIGGLREFSKQFPKEFCAESDSLTVKLWSGRDGRVLDYRQTTMVKDWWKEWVEFAGKSKDLKNLKEYQPEAVKAATPSSVGVARTHELTFSWREKMPDDGSLRVFGAACDYPPLVCPDPRWTCHVDSRAFWPMAAKGEGGKEFEDIGEFISTWFDEYMVPLNYFHYTGWYHAGKCPEGNIYFSQTDDKGVKNVYLVWYRIGLSQNIHNANKNVLIGWARSADRKYYDAAYNFIRWLNDYGFTHWSGGRFNKQIGYYANGGSHTLPEWGGSGGLLTGGDNEHSTSLALLYLLNDTRWARDTLEPVPNNMLNKFVNKYGGSGGPDQYLNSLIGLYRIFPSTELKERARAQFRLISDPNGPGGMNEEWFKKNLGGHYANPLYKLNRKMHTFMEYCNLFGCDEYSLGVLAKGAEEIYGQGNASSGGGQGFPQVCVYCEYYGALNAEVARHKAGNPETRNHAAAQLQIVRELFSHYKKLPPSEVLGDHFFKNLGTDPGSGSMSRSYYFPEMKRTIKDKDGKPIQTDVPMKIGPETTPTPFISMPAVIWMMMDFKEPEWDRKN